ncbi:MAG: hypothetical protein ACE14L_03900 [Terriglobales bacterium]
MTAEQALTASPTNLIKAEARNGIVTIYRSPDPAHRHYDVRFLPRGSDGQLDMSGMALLGTYPSLREALQAATHHYAASQDWHPETRAELFEDRNTGALLVRAPQTQQRSRS